MKRREFIAGLGGAAVAWPLAVRAEKSPAIIAILGSGAAGAASSKLQMTSLESGLRELDLLTGRDYVFESRWAGSDASRFPALAAELLAYRPAAVIVSTNLAAVAFQNLSRTVPIIGTSLNTPVARGLIRSLAKPGGNITGVSTMAEDLSLKLIEIVHEVLPDVHKITIMTNPTNASNAPMLDLLSDQAAKIGFLIESVGVKSSADLDAAFADVSKQRPGALFVLTDNSLFGLADNIISRALALGIPTLGSFANTFARSGALFAYGRDPEEAFRGVARLFKKILNGASPAELPVEQPTKFNLVVNLKTASALGIVLPPTFVARADEVIE